MPPPQLPDLFLSRNRKCAPAASVFLRAALCSDASTAQAAHTADVKREALAVMSARGRFHTIASSIARNVSCSALGP